jgi:hypothetical protein
MGVDHIAGIEYGVDYRVVAVFLVWIVLTVALVILLEFSGPAQRLPAVVLPRMSPTSRTCVLQDDDSGWQSEQRRAPSNRNIADPAVIFPTYSPTMISRLRTAESSLGT